MIAADPYDVPHTARPYGCECGAGLHEGETHEEALAAEAVEASTPCNCGGYTVDGEVLHDGMCNLSPWPEVRPWPEDGAA